MLVGLYMYRYNKKFLISLFFLSSICNNLMANSLENGQFFNGLIVDETITKPAHDFSNIFYQKWMAINDEQFINLTIKEQPGRFRGGFIMVYMQDEIIFRALLPYRHDDIEQLADTAIQSINQALYRKAFIKDQLDNY